MAAGLSVALEAEEGGAKRAPIVDREPAGGILLQAHSLRLRAAPLQQEVTGPEYAERMLEQVLETEI